MFCHQLIYKVDLKYRVLLILLDVLGAGILQGALRLGPHSLFILPAQQAFAPPGLLLHPRPPHFPHFFAQHTLLLPLLGIPLNAPQPRF